MRKVLSKMRCIGALLFKVVLPLLLIYLWVYQVYQNCGEAPNIDLWKFWIISGLPFGIKKMGFQISLAGPAGLAFMFCEAVVVGAIGGLCLIWVVLGRVRVLFDILFDFFFPDGLTIGW